MFYKNVIIGDGLSIYETMASLLCMWLAAVIPTTAKLISQCKEI